MGEHPPPPPPGIEPSRCFYPSSCKYSLCTKEAFYNSRYFGKMRHARVPAFELELTLLGSNVRTVSQENNLSSSERASGIRGKRVSVATSFPGLFLPILKGKALGTRLGCTFHRGQTSAHAKDWNHKVNRFCECYAFKQ